MAVIFGSLDARREPEPTCTSSNMRWSYDRTLRRRRPRLHARTAAGRQRLRRGAGARRTDRRPVHAGECRPL